MHRVVLVNSSIDDNLLHLGLRTLYAVYIYPSCTCWTLYHSCSFDLEGVRAKTRPRLALSCVGTGIQRSMVETRYETFNYVAKECKYDAVQFNCLSFSGIEATMVDID